MVSIDAPEYAGRHLKIKNISLSKWDFGKFNIIIATERLQFCEGGTSTRSIASRSDIFGMGDFPKYNIL